MTDKLTEAVPGQAEAVPGQAEAGDVLAMAAEVQVGARLRAGREAMGMQIEEMARILRLGARQVEAIESGDLAALPGKTFVRGFVRNYARAVQMDAAPLLAQLDQVSQLAAPALNLPESTHVTMPEQGRGVNKDMLTVGAGVVLVLGALAAYFFLPDRFWVKAPPPEPELAAASPAPTPGEPVFPPADTAEEGAEAADAANAATVANPAAAGSVTAASATATGAAVAVPPAAEGVGSVAASAPAAAPAAGATAAAATPVAKGSLSHTGQPAQANAPAAPSVAAVPAAAAAAIQGATVAAGSQVLQFRFERDSWVEVRDKDGNLITSRLHPAGSSRDIAGVPPLNVVVGNASQVKLHYRGQPVALQPNAESDVARLTLQ